MIVVYKWNFYLININNIKIQGKNNNDGICLDYIIVLLLKYSTKGSASRETKSYFSKLNKVTRRISLSDPENMQTSSSHHVKVRTQQQQQYPCIPT